MFRAYFEGYTTNPSNARNRDSRYRKSAPRHMEAIAGLILLIRSRTCAMGVPVLVVLLAPSQQHTYIFSRVQIAAVHTPECGTDV